jgi:hypothetical protein
MCQAEWLPGGIVTRLALGGLCCAALLHAIAQPAAEQNQLSNSRGFVVAVAAGETLLPIGRFTGTEWVNTWPEPDDEWVPVPALDAIPGNGSIALSLSTGRCGLRPGVPREFGLQAPSVPVDVSSRRTL